MGLSRDRAESALDASAELSDFRRGALQSFLSALLDDKLAAMRIVDNASDDQIAGFLDREEKMSGEMMFLSMNHDANAPCTCTSPTSM